MKLDLTKRQIEVIIECLEEIWDCYDDCPFYSGDGIKDEIRKRIVVKLKKLK